VQSGVELLDFKPLIAEEKEDVEMLFFIGEKLEDICFAVPKSAMTRCHWSSNKMFAGFRSLWAIFFSFKTCRICTISAA
jgi:hypothetical protein